MSERSFIAQKYESSYHVPVLLEESIEALVTRSDGIYIDATMGGGGHTRALLDRLSPQGRLFSFDQDIDAQSNAPSDDRFTFIASNFRYIRYWMDYYNVPAVDGILADLGVSSHHFDTPERGFSFRFGQTIPDMRMNSHAKHSAKDLLQTSDEEVLSTIFSDYGELPDAPRLAKMIVEYRGNSPLNNMEDVLSCLEAALPKQPQQRHRKLSRIFQALRIEINDELQALRELLIAGSDLLRPHGRFVILTYHSLEDRIIKKWIQAESAAETSQTELLIYGARPGRIRQLKKYSSKPCQEEIRRNSRASSANMRVIEKLS